MSSSQRQALLKQKMKAQGLVEGSGVKPLSSYNTDEIWDLIKITRCFPEMQSKTRRMQTKPTKKENH